MEKTSFFIESGTKYQLSHNDGYDYFLTSNKSSVLKLPKKIIPLSPNEKIAIKTYEGIIKILRRDLNLIQ